MTFRWNRRQIIGLILVVILAVALYFIGYCTYIVPLENKVEVAEEKLVIQENLLANVQEEVALNDDSQVTTSLQRRIPIEKTTDQVVYLLNDIAISTNSIISQMTVFENVAEDTVNTSQQSSHLEELKTIQFQLQVASESYEDMHHFLDGINNADRIWNIQQLEFGDGMNEQVQFSVTLFAYYSPSLTELLIEAPTYQYEPSANKTTPFSE